MATKLKKFFPMIREREEVLIEIHKKKPLVKKFESWTKEQQEEFLDICTGARGLKLLYDGFFKEVMNPEYNPERLSDFLSCMLKQRVRVIKAIPTDSTRLASESALLAMDIVVELEDGSIANVEMQRIGYLFPGQRSACYSADLLLRQYKRVRGDKDNFDYRDVKNVYTIVLFEKSPKAFHKFPRIYYHFFEQKSDTGLEMELLQKYLFIPLDIFKKKQQNRGDNNKRDAWLTLFSSDDPEVIAELLDDYPEFKDIYREGCQICLNIEKVMEMFSEELYIMDRNTEKYMFEEMQKEMEQFKDEYEKAKNEYEKTKDECEKVKDELEKFKGKLEESKYELKKSKGELEESQNDLYEMNEKYIQAVKSGIEVMRSVGMSAQEIIAMLCKQYHMTEGQAKEFL